MARYIDADKFAARIKASPAFRNINDGLLLQRVAIDLLNNMPTADVVPKSEVEELKAIIADHKANEERWEELYSNTKTEVTREIFEEIERRTIDIKFEQVTFSAIRSEQLAKLKQKYTGEET